jgi:hypothetical protein
VLAVPLHEASVKLRTGDPEDEDFDVAAGGVWAGVVPLRTTTGPVRTSADAEGIAVPVHVSARAAQLAGL